jgi:ferredoxin
VLVWRKERIWCNTICPVGTFLGLLSRFSLFQVSIDANRCNHCKNCTSSCKSRCIDDTQFKVDASRCVACYNCLDKCKQNAIHYRPNGWCKVKYKTEPKPAASAKKAADVKSQPQAGEETLNTFQLSRRRFVQGSALTLATLPFLSYAAAGKAKEPKYETRSRYPLPPGTAPDFHEKCTGCQLCVSQCPMQVLRPAFMEHGVLSMMQPLLYFHPHAYCNYQCTLCSTVCPNGAILPLAPEEKRLRQIGEVHFVENECVVKKFDQDCGACAEHCPTLAVHMVPYHNGLTIPAIDPAICVGCGACESICPVRPKAIFVEGLPSQRSIDAALMDAPTGGGEVDLDSLYDNVFGDESSAVEGTEAAEATSTASELTDTLPAAESAPIDFGF